VEDGKVGEIDVEGEEKGELAAGERCSTKPHTHTHTYTHVTNYCSVI
jgi:hypothetical protein